MNIHNAESRRRGGALSLSLSSSLPLLKRFSTNTQTNMALRESYEEEEEEELSSTHNTRLNSIIL